MWSIAGSLTVHPATDRTDLLAEPVTAALAALDPADAARCGVAEIDPDLADTAAFCDTYGSPPEASANCVVVAGKRDGEQRFAACLVLATTRADVNGVVRRRLDVRKASFAPMDDAVALTGMAYGGITPFGLPSGWPLLIDEAVAAAPELVVGSGVRNSKLFTSGDVLAKLTGAEVLAGLGRPVG
jgi:prolyl-tRNA editing enzyme YbaK/EbsC (Cys-tRNA(Pro) deacylase)